MAATYTNRARRLGREHGRSAASWVQFSPTEAREWLRADREGDFMRDKHGPNGMPLDSGPFGWDKLDPQDYVPSGPLSGEWADGQLMDDIGASRGEYGGDDYERTDALCDVYEAAYEDAYREVARIARLAAQI